jgi:hypothetical protein
MSAVDGSKPEAVEGGRGCSMYRLRVRASCIRNCSSLLGRIILQDPAEAEWRLREKDSWTAANCIAE